MSRNPKNDLRDINAMGFLGRASPQRIKQLILFADEMIRYIPRLAEEIRREGR